MFRLNNNQTRQLRPANENIWYVLATIAGEPDAAINLAETVARNQYYWNGLMRSRVDVYGGMVESRLGHDIELPTLTQEDLQTIREALDARGFQGIGIPHVNSPIDLEGVIFPHGAWFNNFVFGGDAVFDGARFGGPINVFMSATFAGNVSFREIEFHGQFVGSGMEFVGSTNFNDATFLRDADFSGCKFVALSEFDGASFMQAARFNRSSFAAVGFRGTVFNAEASFEQCDFASDALFPGTVFEDRVEFNGAQFAGATSFGYAQFKDHVPGFSAAKLHEFTDWNEARWPKTPRALAVAREHVERYQCLARLMNDLQKFDYHHLFFRKELYARRRAEPRSLTTLMDLLYEGICDYGNGLGQVALIWLVHMILGAMALCLSKFIDSWDQGSKWQALRESFSDFHYAWLLSLGHAHGFLDLNNKFFEDTRKAWEDVPWFGGIGAAQTILGVIILFFLLLTIRNRFRMR